MNTSFITTHDPEYDKAFWNAMKGNNASAETLSSGKTSMGTIKLPSYTAGKFSEALAKNGKWLMNDETAFALRRVK